MHDMTRLLSADASCVHLSSRYPCLTGSLYVSSTSISSLPPWKQQLYLQLYIDTRSSSTRSHHVRSCASQPVVCATPAALLVTAQHIGSMRRGTVATGLNAAPLQNVRRSVTVCRCERTVLCVEEMKRK